MGILDIPNRTENWETAKAFVPFFQDNELLSNLVKRLNPCDTSEKEDLKIELFWKGFRDYRHEYEKNHDKKAFGKRLAEQYERNFECLRNKIVCFGEFQELEDENYAIKKDEYNKTFVNNILNTEIDIVIQSKCCLYLGEAKKECAFSADSRNVLVHQLVRQRVLGTLLLNTLNSNLKLKQFVVMNNEPKEGRRPKQLQFAINQKWIKKTNILTWDGLASIANGS